MRIVPKRLSLKHSLLIYRKIRHSKGHGIHSPFVFNLITKVIRERGSFYRFKDIELLRKRLLQNETPIFYTDTGRKIKQRKSTIAEVVRREAIQPKTGALLFRLTNYFKAEHILHIGSSMGLSTLYMTSYAPGLTGVSLESTPEFASIAKWVYGQAARTHIDQQVGKYEELLPVILRENPCIDFVFFNTRREQINILALFKLCMQHTDPDCVFVFDGIRSNKHILSNWKDICNLPEVTVTIDLYNVGIVFVNKKLYKRNYKVYF